MPPLECVCGALIPFNDAKVGPISKIGSLMFYETSADWGRPTSRQRVLFCEKHTLELIDFLKKVQFDGPDVEGVS